MDDFISAPMEMGILLAIFNKDGNVSGKIEFWRDPSSATASGQRRNASSYFGWGNAGSGNLADTYVPLASPTPDESWLQRPDRDERAPYFLDALGG
jgi:hypothetical protein